MSSIPESTTVSTETSDAFGTSPGVLEIPLANVSPRLRFLKNQVLKSHGRAPWYGEDGLPVSDAFVIGIAGGSASGKTHVARQIVQSLGSIPTVIILSQDSFYKKHSPEELELAFANKLDFDHPDAIDMELFAAVTTVSDPSAQCLADLKACRQTNIPIYSFTHHQRLEETKYLYGASIIIMLAEGILALHDPKLRELYDLKIFVHCDSDMMLARRIKRDMTERGRSVEGILDQYLRHVKPSFDNFVSPTAKYADIIVPGSNNAVAIGLISTHIRRELTERAVQLRTPMPFGHCEPSAGLSPLALDKYSNLYVLPQTPQLKGIYTVLRDRTTPRLDFIFFVDRLATILMEKALEHLPTEEKTVITPVDCKYVGRQYTEAVCGVSILRSGGPLERGMQRVIRDVAIGSLLIQSDAKTGEPLLLHVLLPTRIRYRHFAKETWVFLLDALISTSAAAFMAVRILLDHGVREDRIVLVTFLTSPCGVSVLGRIFPQVKIFTGGIDTSLREIWLEGNQETEGQKVWCLEPGMGQLGDRYYL